MYTLDVVILDFPGTFSASAGIIQCCMLPCIWFIWDMTCPTLRNVITPRSVDRAMPPRVSITAPTYNTYTGQLPSPKHRLTRTCVYSASTEKIKVQRPRPSIPSVRHGGWRAASLLRNFRRSDSQNLSEKNVAVLTAPSFLERFCEADWHNSETK